MGTHLFVPIYDFVLGLSCCQVIIYARISLSNESFTFDARVAYCFIISIYLSTFRISFLMVLIDCSLVRDLMTKELNDFLVMANSFSISFT
jgi:hypothetical protein